MRGLFSRLAGVFGCRPLLGLGADLALTLQKHGAKGRDADGHGGLLTVGGLPADLAGGGVAHAGAAVLGRVAVEHLHIFLHRRTAEPVALIGVGAEVDGAEHLVAGLVPAQEDDHIVAVVIGHQPLEALPVEVHLPESALLQIELVDILDILVQLAVGLVLQQLPVELAVIGPLLLRTQLHAHKAQLLARMGHGVGVEAPDAGEFLPRIPRHLAQHGTLHMDHLVVGQRQDIVFGKSVEHGERDVLVVALAEPGVHLQVVAHVVHPAHVPLQVEAQPADAVGADHVGRLCDQGPRGGLLGNHQRMGVDRKGGLVQRLQKLNGLQMLLAAVDVGGPLAVPAVIIQVQHGGHRVHADAVQVVLLQPEGGGGEQEALHLRPAVVEYAGAPGGVLALAHIGVLIAGGTVKLIQAVLVLAEVGGHPVQNDAHALLVHIVHKEHEVLRGAVAAGGRKVAGALVAPAGVVGVLGDGQQLDEVEAHLLHIGGQRQGQVPVIEHVPIFMGAPGAQMDLVDVQGGVVNGLLAPGLLPGAVVPLEVLQAVELAGGAGAGLGVEGVGVGLQMGRAVGAGDGKFVGVIDVSAGNKAFPDALGDLLHRMGGRIP